MVSWKHSNQWTCCQVPKQKKLQLTLQPYTLEMFSLLHKEVEGKQVSFWEKSTKSKQDGNQCPLANKAGGYTIYYNQSSKFLM